MAKVPFLGNDVEADPVDMISDQETWNEYQLGDGTLLRMKTIVSEIFKIRDQYDEAGNPVYFVKSGNVLSVRSPEHLKKPKD